MTPEDIEAEWWAYYFDEKNVTESGEDEEFNTADVLAAMESDDWEELLK